MTENGFPRLPEDEEFEPIVSIVRLPDGRFAARNEQDFSEHPISGVELEEILGAFRLWWEVRAMRL